MNDSQFFNPVTTKAFPYGKGITLNNLMLTTPKGLPFSVTKLATEQNNNPYENFYPNSLAPKSDGGQVF